MELIIGNNIIRNTTGVLVVDGKEQIFLELGKHDGQLLLTIDIYDSNGEHVAKLRRNTWVFNNGEQFEVSTDPTELKLINKETGEVLVEACVLERDNIHIPNGRFFSSKGHLVEISPISWRLANGFTMSGTVIDNCGAAVVLG